MLPSTQQSKSIALFLGILFFASLIIYLFLWRDAPYLAPDSQGYMRFAQDLEDGKLNYFHDRTIGYPLFLLLAQSSHHPSKGLFVLQLLLHFGSVSLVVSVLYQHRVSQKTLFSFAVICISPPFISYAAFVLTESILSFCLILSFFSLRQWIIYGARTGLVISMGGIIACGLIRPSMFVMGFVIAILIAFWRKTDKHQSIDLTRLKLAQRSLIIFPLLVCFGLIIFNLKHFHYFGVTPMMWKYLSTKTVRVTERIPSNVPVKEYLVQTRDKALLKPNSSHTGQAYMHDIDEATLSALSNLKAEDLPQYMTRIQIQLIMKSPLTYAADVGSAMVTYWFPRSFAPHSESRLIQLLWSIIDMGVISVFFVVTTLLFSSLLLLRQWKISFAASEEKDAILQASLSILLLVGIIWFNAISSSLFSIGDARYRYPTDILILLSIVLSYQTLQKIKKQVISMQSKVISV